MNKSFSHLMVDIETMGNQSHSAIVSIGAIEFDINTGETGKTFYRNVSLQSSLNVGLKVTADTVMWWMRQSEEARTKLTTDLVSLETALTEFSQFCNNTYEVWGNSARFDLGLLQNAYEAIGQPICWDFRKERCVRTLVSFRPEIKAAYKATGVLHDALSDCRNQIEYCTEIWNAMKK